MGPTAFSTKTGILLVQLGSPKDASIAECRKFLREFLMDPYVIDLPWLPRWLLVNLIIAPFRASKSAAAYQKIWKVEGGPLRSYSLEFESALSESLGPEIPVVLGMRYGEPSLRKACGRLSALKVNCVIVVPLYPQYAESSYRTAAEAAEKILKSVNPAPTIKIFSPFYKADFFLRAWREVARGFDFTSYDHILMSYHGIPEGHVHKTDPLKTHCLRATDCCLLETSSNKDCYRHQCFETTKGIVRELGLPSNKVSTSFQSRLGGAAWIKPYTDEVLLELAAAGKRRVAVFSPSFVVDGLESLEEIEIRGRENFIQAGGKSLDLVPSLNANLGWVQGVSSALKMQIAALP